MRLTFSPVELPFAVGDAVWVDQPYSDMDEFPFFQGIITQIIVEGNASSTMVIRQRKETHELILSRAIYGLKPIGQHAGGYRVNVVVNLYPLQIKLFATKDELLHFQDQPE